MNFVALALLEAAGNNEEYAFWALVGLSERLAMEGVWCPGLHRLEFALFALQVCTSVRTCMSVRGSSTAHKGYHFKCMCETTLLLLSFSSVQQP